ncbi:MAG: hypothetical protein LIO63_08940 [Akkermansia sp.]|nr:hypothetical protein [Akkermansia sp.]
MKSHTSLMIRRNRPDIPKNRAPAYLRLGILAAFIFNAFIVRKIWLLCIPNGGDDSWLVWLAAAWLAAAATACVNTEKITPYVTIPLMLVVTAALGFCAGLVSVAPPPLPAFIAGCCALAALAFFGMYRLFKCFMRRKSPAQATPLKISLLLLTALGVYGILVLSMPASGDKIRARIETAVAQMGESSESIGEIRPERLLSGGLCGYTVRTENTLYYFNKYGALIRTEPCPSDKSEEYRWPSRTWPPASRHFVEFNGRR